MYRGMKPLLCGPLIAQIRVINQQDGGTRTKPGEGDPQGAVLKPETLNLG